MNAVVLDASADLGHWTLRQGESTASRGASVGRLIPRLAGSLQREARNDLWCDAKQTRRMLVT